MDNGITILISNGADKMTLRMHKINTNSNAIILCERLYGNVIDYNSAYRNVCPSVFCWNCRETGRLKQIEASTQRGIRCL